MKKILVIDDDKKFGNFIKDNLAVTGIYEVTTVSDGKSGIKLASSNKPSLILLDIMMPGMSGFDVLKELKDNLETASIPVVMLTAVDSDEAKSRASSMYNEDYITKPIEIKELKNKIEEVLSRTL